MIRNLRCTVTIDSVLANSKTQNAFLFTVNAIFRQSRLPRSGWNWKYAKVPSTKKTWRDSLPIDMLLSAVSVLVVAQWISEIPEGLMNNPVLSCFRDTRYGQLKYSFNWKDGTSLNMTSSARARCDWNHSQNWIRRSVSWNFCIKCISYGWNLWLAFSGVHLSSGDTIRHATLLADLRELAVILASTTLLSSSPAEILGGKHSRSPKVWNKFD